MKAKFSVQIFWLVFSFTTCFGQEEVVLSNHKPLLGEVHYGNRIGGVQAQEGRSIQMISFEENDNLNSIQVFLNEDQIVTGFKLEVERKGGIKVFSFGNLNSFPQEIFFVQKNAKLVGISGTSGWFIDSLAFIFDDGSSTPKYGGTGGDLNFKLVLNKKPTGIYLGRLMGFWGSHTDLLETIGLVFWPIE